MVNSKNGAVFLTLFTLQESWRASDSRLPRDLRPALSRDRGSRLQPWRLLERSGNPACGGSEALQLLQRWGWVCAADRSGLRSLPTASDDTIWPPVLAVFSTLLTCQPWFTSLVHNYWASERLWLSNPVLQSEQAGCYWHIRLLVVYTGCDLQQCLNKPQCCIKTCENYCYDLKIYMNLVNFPCVQEFTKCEFQEKQ